MNLGSRDKFLSFCILVNNQINNTTLIKINKYNEIAVEKSILIIYFCTAYGVPRTAHLARYAVRGTLYEYITKNYSVASSLALKSIFTVCQASSRNAACCTKR